jgi:hypothetical protein
MLTVLANVPDLPPVGTVIVRGETDQHTAWVERIKKRYPQMFGKCSVADMFALRHLLRAAWDDQDLRRREWFCFLLRKLHAESERLAESFRKDAGALVHQAQVNKDQLEYFLNPDPEKRPVAQGLTVPQMLYNLADSDLVAAYKNASPPTPNEFESAVFYLQRNLTHALHCPNPTCASGETYFFLATKGQRYCGEDCAKWGQQQSKRTWWAKNRAKPKSKRRR